MLFTIHAEIIEPTTGKPERGTGTVSDTAKTKQEAILKARMLREQGFSVLVTDSYGEMVPDEDAR